METDSGDLVILLPPSISLIQAYSKAVSGQARCQAVGQHAGQHDLLSFSCPALQMTPAMDFGGSFSHNASNLAP